MKKVLILGSTGSVGQSTLEVIEANKEDFSLAGLVAKSNEKLLLEQANKYKVNNICLINKKSKNDFFISESELEDLIFSSFSGITFYFILTACSLMAVFGDFIESRIKRIANVKDSGSLLPGHGGILDRIDSHIVVVPAFFILLGVIT